MYLRKKGVAATESNESGSLIVRLTCTIWMNVTVEGFNGGLVLSIIIPGVCDH